MLTSLIRIIVVRSLPRRLAPIVLAVEVSWFIVAFIRSARADRPEERATVAS